MALIRSDRVQETSTSSGTGAKVLAGAVTGYRTVASIASNNDTLEFGITDGTNWEVGLYTFSSGTNSITISGSPYSSSNGGAAVNFSGATLNIFNDIPAKFFNTAAAFGGTITATSFNGVALTTAGVVTNFLNETGTYTAPAGSGGITVGTTTVTSGTTTRILYDNAGVVGEYTISGTGTTVPLTASPAFTGTVTAAAITATGNVSGGVFIVTAGTPSGTGIYLATTNTLGFMANGAGIGAFSVGNLKLGASDAASPVAQLVRVQNVVTGTTDTAGANWTFAGSQGTGTGAGGSYIWQVAPASTTGSTPNTLVTGASLTSAGIFDLNQSGSILRLQGANFATYPNTDSTATGASIAIGVSALSTQNAAGSAAFNNTAVGYQAAAGATMTTAAIKNTLVGFQAANGLTSGGSNVIIGYQAGASGVTFQSGASNVIIGSIAHTASASSGNAVVIGQNAVVAGNSVAVGQGATANGGSSVVIGLSANDGSNSGVVAIGASAGNASLGGSATAVGLSALNSTSGAGNTAVGNTAGKFISSGTNNTALGFQALLGITGTKVTGSGNTAIGKDAGLALQGVGATNTLIGISAGDAITSGVANVVIGANVAHTQATGGSNIYIGCSNAIDASSSSTSNELKIGNSSTPVISATGINSTPVTTLGGANTLSGITTFGSGIVRKNRVVTAAGAVTVATTDHVIFLNKTVGAATIFNLPASPTTGTEFIIKDAKGDAGTNNITLTPAAGNIDGQTTYVIVTNYGGATIVYNGTEWSVTCAV